MYDYDVMTIRLLGKTLENCNKATIVSCTQNLSQVGGRHASP